MQITVIEPTWNHMTHLPANLGCLRILRHLYPSARITYVAGAAQWRELRKMAGEEFTSALEQVECTPGLDQDTMPNHIWRGWRRLAAVPRALMTDTDLLVLCSCTASALWGICAMGLAKKTLAYLHGNANEIGGWRSRNPLRRALDFHAAARTFSRLGGRLLVLENRIQHSLEADHPWLQGRLHAIGHTLLEEEGRLATPDKTIGNPIRIGFAGMATPAKGFPQFLEFSRALDRRQPGRYEFHTYGYLHPSCKNCDQSLLKTKADKSIPREDFIQGLLGLDFIFAWHQADYYTQAASGIVYDAINLGVPLIARNCAQINEFQKNGFPIALAVDSVAEAVDLMAHSEKSAAAYPSLLDGLERARERLSTPKLAQDMKKIISAR